MSIFYKSLTVLRDSHNKYYIFKNADRRRRLRASNFFLNVLFILCYLTFAVTFVWLTILFAGGLFGLFLKDDYVKNMITPSIILLVSVAVFIVFYVLKFFIEGRYIKKEVEELSVEPQLNRNYLAIAETVNKVRKLALICSLVGLVLVGIGAALAILEIGVVVMIAFILAIVLYVVFGILKFRMYTAVHDEIMNVREERKQLKKN